LILKTIANGTYKHSINTDDTFVQYINDMPPQNNQ